MDSPPHGLDQRDQHALFDRHRRRANHPARRLAVAGRAQSPGERRLSRSPTGERAVGRRRPSCSGTRGRCTSSGWNWASPGSRPARICRSRPTPKPIGRSTCTICCTSWHLRMDATRSGRSASTPRRSASRSSARCFRWFGRRLSTIAWKGCYLTRLDREVIVRWSMAGSPAQAAGHRRRFSGRAAIRPGPSCSAAASATNAAKNFVCSLVAMNPSPGKKPRMSQPEEEELLELDATAVGEHRRQRLGDLSGAVRSDAHGLRAGGARPSGRGAGVPPLLFRPGRRRRPAHHDHGCRPTCG